MDRAKDEQFWLTKWDVVGRIASDGDGRVARSYIRQGLLCIIEDVWTTLWIRYRSDEGRKAVRIADIQRRRLPLPRGWKMAVGETRLETEMCWKEGTLFQVRGHGGLDACRSQEGRMEGLVWRLFESVTSTWIWS